MIDIYKICGHKNCGLPKDEHERIQVYVESVYGDAGADFYCPSYGNQEYAALDEEQIEAYEAMEAGEPR